MPFNFTEPASAVTWWQVQNSNISSAAFAMLIVWGFSTTYKAIQCYRSKRKLIYLLNVIQSAMMLLKTVSAFVYTILLGLECSSRSVLINVPLLISLDSTYAIMLIKLLLFTPFRWTTRGFFGLSLLAHATVNLVGVAMRKSSSSSSGMCRDTYPIVFKQQYIIEAILECYTAVALVHGIAIKARANGSILTTTSTVLQQLRQNEHVRVFSILIVIALKLFMTYYTVNIGFDYGFLTHSVDQMRSAIICWALMRDYRRLTKSATNSRNALSRSLGSPLTGAHGAQQPHGGHHGGSVMSSPHGAASTKYGNKGYTGSKVSSMSHDKNGINNAMRGSYGYTPHSIHSQTSSISKDDKDTHHHVVASKAIHKGDPIYEDDGDDDFYKNVDVDPGVRDQSPVYVGSSQEVAVAVDASDHDHDGNGGPVHQLDAGDGHVPEIVKSNETIGVFDADGVNVNGSQ